MKRALISLPFILSPGLLFSQNFFPVNEDVTPPSPNASSIACFGEVPVSLYTGLPDISIPLGEAKGRKISVPIVLSYHAAGIKVDDVPSWVGCNWSLNAGGQITRVVHGLPDEVTGSNAGYEVWRSNIPDYDYTDDDNYGDNQGFAEGRNDGEPDEYFYSFGGKSGSFVMGNDGAWQTIPYDDIKIERFNLGADKYWVITDADGTIYYFGLRKNSLTFFIDGIESTSNESSCGDSKGQSWPSTWNLTRIESPNSTDFIDFEYASYSEEYPTGTVETNFYSLANNVDPESCSAQTDQSCSNLLFVNGKRLSKIYFADGYIQFNEKTDFLRADLRNLSSSNTNYPLGSIDIYNEGALIKSYLFDYTYYYKQSLPTRLKLISVTEKAPDGTLLPSFKFDYDSTVLPPLNYNTSDLSAKGQDHWGFYNGVANNQTLIPPAYEPITNMYLSGADRDPYWPYTGAGILTKITYPTQGYTQLNYEPNYFGYNPDLSPVSVPVGVNIVYEAHAEYAKGSVDAAEDSKPFTIAAPGYDVQVSWGDNTNKNCSESETDYEIYRSDHSIVSKPPLSGGTIHLDAGDYSVYADAFSTCDDADAWITVSYDSTVSYSKTQQGGGLRIKTITQSDGDSDHTNDIVKNYSYVLSSEQDRSSGVTFATPTYTYYYDIDQPKLGGTLGSTVECTYFVTTPSSQTVLGTSKGGYVGYQEVKVTDGNSTTNNGWTINKFTMKATVGYYAYPFAPTLNLDAEKGLPYEIATYDHSGNVLKKISNQYFTDPVNHKTFIYGLKVAYTLNNAEYNGPTYDKFTGLSYSLLSEWVYLNQSTETDYDVGNSSASISTITQYYYDNPTHLQRTRTVTTRSNGTTETEVMRYPKDYSVPENYSGSNHMLQAIAKMDTMHMDNILIEDYKKISVPSTPFIKITNTGLGNVKNTQSFNANSPNKQPKKQTQVFSFDNNASVISGNLALYRLNHDKIVQDSIFHLDLQDPLSANSFLVSSGDATNFKRDSHYRAVLAFDNYDDSIRLINFHRPFDLVTSLIYDYPSGKVAAVTKGSVQNKTAYTGFEGANAGGWTYNISGIKKEGTSGINNAPTGDYFFQFGSSLTIKAKNLASGTYIISFWYKGAPVVAGGTIQKTTTGEVVNGFTYKEYQVKLTSTGTITISGTNSDYIDELRLYPSSAVMTSYAYTSSQNISESCDENNYIHRFEYDAFNRLNYSSDQYLNGLSYIDYHYKDPDDNNDHTFIRTEIANSNGLNKSALSSGTAMIGSVLRHLEFFDGLGRSIQKISVQESPLQRDIITPATYDVYGREPKKYLSYTSVSNSGTFRKSAITDQANFYLTSPDLPATSYPYSETSFESSPLNRPVTQASPGETWRLGAHNVTLKYGSNAANEVRHWVNSSGTWSATSYFPAGALLVNETIDENGNMHFTFKDKNGLLILEANQKSNSIPPGSNVLDIINDNDYAETYYLYDDMLRLSQVISPAGGDYMQTIGNYTLTSDISDKWDFQYQYNQRGEVSEKKNPGEDWMYITYDQLDRVAMTQDPNQRAISKWTFNKYDDLGNLIVTGYYVSEGPLSLSDVQDTLWSSKANLYESRSTVQGGYTDNVYPPNDFTQQLLVNYFGNYDFDSNGADDFIPVSSPSDIARTRNKLTGVFTQILSAAPGTFAKQANYYDYRYRIIETEGINEMGNTEQVLNTYNFAGNITNTVRNHQYPLGPHLSLGMLSITGRCTFDFANRPIDSYISVSGTPEIWTTDLTYNELAQIKQKALHNELSDNGSGFGTSRASLQNLDYKYNIRGWLTDMNDITSASTMSTDYFAMKLHYDDNNNAVSAAAEYNGNISWEEWRTARDSIKREYGFSYDKLNRLTKANYAAYDKNEAAVETDRYTVNNLKYDNNGNILSMKVKGVVDKQKKDFSYGVSDDLTYNYDGNKLTKVTDAGAGVWSNGLDFRGTGGNYAYDANANMITDPNKSISITYNYLNLPESISKSSGDNLKVSYDASGNKWREITKQDGKKDSTHYFGNIIYEKGTAKRILFADGYLLKDSASGKWNPYYFIKDHLGNIRIVFKGSDINTIESPLTMEANKDEEGDYPKYHNVSTTRNNLEEYQGLSSAEVNNQQGPYTDAPVKNRDSVKVSVYYYWQKDGSEKPKENSNSSATNHHIPPPIIQLQSPTLSPAIPGNESVSKTPLPQVGMQFNVVGLFNWLHDAHRNHSQNHRVQSPQAAPDAYLLVQLQDTDNNVAQEWRYQSDSADTWVHLSDSIRIVLPDTTKSYHLHVALMNNSSENVWFDTLNLKVLSPTSPIIQENDYYPFGNMIDGLCWQAGNEDTSRYRYNSKEWHNPFQLNWLDYGARWYDPQVGRWWTMDPLAEKYLNMSLFNYCMNEPVKIVDRNGKAACGDYYNKKGEYIGTDGKHDNKVYTVNTDLKPIRNAKQMFLESDIKYEGKVTDVNLEFSGQANSQNLTEADGTLSVIQVTDNNKKFTRMKIDAIGGPYDNGAPPNGDYTVDNPRTRSEDPYTRDGFGFSFDLNPSFATQRTALRIHPDGNGPGTRGCIGLECTGDQGNSFYNTIKTSIEDFGALNLNVDITNNPNNQGETKYPQSVQDDNDE